VSPTAQIDPEVVEAMVAGGLDPAVAAPPPSLELLETMRAQPLRIPFDPVPPAGVRREELTIPGLDGAPAVPIRVYRRSSRPSSAAPGLVWIHGGGYILGTYDMDASFLDPLVTRTGCVAVSVEYRLAPETPYPGALDDCFAALSFLFEQADELGVEASRLAVGGFSAGAGLAAACALRARDARIPLVHQHLVYPMLDDRQTTPSSRWDLLAVWSRELNAFAWKCYLGELYGTDAVPSLAAPARAGDLAGLAPAYVHVGSLDGFLHEDIDYAARLLSAGVPTELHVLPLVPHGFEHVAPEAAVSKTANALSEAALARVLATDDRTGGPR
jgi:acetyl esterase/lipase